MRVISEVIRKTDFLGRGVLWDNVKYPRPVWLPNSLPSPAHICDAPLPSDPCLPVFVFSYHYLVILSSVCDDPGTQNREWTGGAHCDFPSTVRRATALTCRGCNRHQQSDNCSSSWNNTAKSGSPTSVAVSEYPCWLKRGVGFCEYSLAVSCQFCLQACKPCSPLKSVTWLCMAVISGWNRNLSVSICFEGAKYN